MASGPDPAALQVAYATRVASVRARILAFIAATWLGLEAWRDDDIDRFVATVLPMVLGGQQAVSALTNGYLTQLAVLRFGGKFEPADVALRDVTGAAVRGGTPPEDVYHRAGVQVWTSLAGGSDLTTAVRVGMDRAQEAAATDLQLAKTHTARVVLAQDKRGPTGYRRVLEGPTSCGLCALAATQRYMASDLMPIHPACDCGIEPLYGWNDQVLDPAERDRIHALAANYFGAGVDTHAASAGTHAAKRQYDFRDFVVVNEHGELGPVLGRKGQAFTGPRDIPAPAVRDTTALQVTQIRERIPALEARVAAGDTSAQAALDFSVRRLAQLTA